LPIAHAILFIDFLRNFRCKITQNLDKNTAFGPRILPGFSGWCPGIRKISEKKPQKDLTFCAACGIISMTVEDGLNRKTGKEGL